MSAKYSVFILTAGLGTRLKPLTDTTPKCLIKVGKKPVIDHILAWLKKYRVKEIFVNLHHLPQPIMEHLGSKVGYSLENTLRGTAGAYKDVGRYLSDPFVVVNGDTITNLNLDVMVEYHKLSNALATVFTQDDLIHCGGVYVFDKKVLNYIPDGKFYMNDTDLIPKLLENKLLVQDYNPKDTYYYDIGDPQRLEKAREALS